MADRITEQTAIAIYQNRASFRREHGLSARNWQELNEASKDEYRSMARASIAVIRGYVMVTDRIPKLSPVERLVQWWHRFKVRNLIADDPHEKRLDARHGHHW